MEGSTTGQVHHGSATTTAAVRRAIQHSQESLTALAKRCGVNPKTVAKRKRRTLTADRRTGAATALPHRAGHGTGLEDHESPYIVAGNEGLPEPGMCVSAEPMIVVPGRDARP